MELRSKYLRVSIIALILTGTIPAFAEVSELSVNQQMYFLGDDILFSGKVDKGTTGLVTIVIRDSNDDFVLLSQTIIQADDTFEKSVKVGDKFTTHGIYNATAFIINMTAGSKATFDVSTDGSLFQYEDSQEPKQNSPVQAPTNTETTSLDIEEPNTAEESEISRIADFVDPEKDPQYYLDRYYNEPAYKSWFDTNYSGMTIEDAVGYMGPAKIENEITEIISEEIIPDAEALSSPPIDIGKPNEISSETTQMALAVGGLVVLLGAVYGVKRKVDNNTEQISQNRNSIKKKLLGGILSNDPLNIIRERLAKGEITINEFNDLKRTLS